MVEHRPEIYDALSSKDSDADSTMVIEPGAGDDQEADLQDETADDEQIVKPASIPEYVLVVRRGQQKGRKWLLAPGVTSMGRHPYSDIALDHITVSRNHCRLSLDSNGLSIEDLGSTNGCYVNDHLVEETTLKAGDRLMIGTFHLLVTRG